MPEKKIRIKLKSFDHKVLDDSLAQIVGVVEGTGAGVVGPIPLPTKLEKFCVIRSPFIDKDSREQFEIRTHKRILDIVNPSSRTVDALTRLELPAGVDIEVKL